MCGIAACFSSAGVVSALDLETLHHRGPDGTGEWASSDGRLWLGHKRLAIVDLSPTGAQPMHDPASGERYAAGDSRTCTDAIVRLLARMGVNNEALRTSAARASSSLPSVLEHFSEQIDLYGSLLDRRPSAK